VPARKANAWDTASKARVLPISITVLGCVLALGIYLSLTMGKSNLEHAAAERRHTSPREVASGTLGRTRVNMEDFSVRRALTDLYGNYDPNLDGAFWRATSAPAAFTDWQDRALFIRPLISRSFEEHGLRRHVLVTNSLDVEDGEVVKQGTGCRTCGSLIGAAIFERSDHEWKLISRHDFLTAGGRWGAPPMVSIDFPVSGGVQLRFDDFAGDSRRGAKTYSILLKERESSRALAVPVSRPGGTNKVGAPQP
jgi:hypothetical protein